MFVADVVRALQIVVMGTGRNLISFDRSMQQVSLFARHFSKSPEELGPDEIRFYQVYLTNERKLAPSSILIAIAALRFLYKSRFIKIGAWKGKGQKCCR